MDHSIDVRHDASRNRYELATDEGIAIAEYRRDGSVIEFFHTAVPEALQGRGLGGRLVAAALADVRERDFKVKPTCPFVRAYIDRHEELADLVAD